MNIIDGKKIANEILENIKAEVKQLAFQPVFCDVLVGDDPASAQYVRMKAKTAEKAGFKFRKAEYPSSITTEDLVSEIMKIGQEPHICGLIIQLPLPASIDKTAVLDAVDPRIDVDCIGKVNSEKFYSGQPILSFPTASAVLALLDSVGQDLTGKNIVMIGQGMLVGKPVKFLLEQRGFSVKTVLKGTPAPENILRQADVIISAAGQPNLVTGEKIKQGAIIIDAGTAELDGGIVGDEDLESVKSKAGFVSPVPGGVGPVTVAKLLRNVLLVAKKKQGKSVI